MGGVGKMRQWEIGGRYMVSQASGCGQTIPCGNGWLWVGMGWGMGAYRHPLSRIASFSPIDTLTTPREYQLPGHRSPRLRGTPGCREARAEGAPI